MSLHNFTACWQGGLFSSSDLSPDLQPTKTEGLCGAGASEPGVKHQTCNLEGTLMTYDDIDGKPSDFELPYFQQEKHIFAFVSPLAGLFSCL